MNNKPTVEKESSSHYMFDNLDLGSTELTAAGVNTLSIKGERDHADLLLSAIKLTFLYAPGVAAIHFLAVGSALLLLYGHLSGPMIAGSIGIAIVCMFMTIFGIGRLSDLRYLGVVGSVAAVSVLTSAIYFVLANLIPGDFFGRFTLYTLPLPLLAGYYVKSLIDSSSESV